MQVNRDLVLVHWIDVVHFADWTPSSDPITDCPEFISVGYLIEEDSSDTTIKIATTFDTNAVGTGVISFPIGVIKEITKIEPQKNSSSNTRSKRKQSRSSKTARHSTQHA